MKYSVKGYLKGTEQDLQAVLTGYTTTRPAWFRQQGEFIHFEVQLATLAIRDSLYQKIEKYIDKSGGYIGVFEAPDDIRFQLVYKYP